MNRSLVRALVLGLLAFEAASCAAPRAAPSLGGGSTPARVVERPSVAPVATEAEPAPCRLGPRVELAPPGSTVVGLWNSGAGGSLDVGVATAGTLEVVRVALAGGPPRGLVRVALPPGARVTNAWPGPDASLLVVWDLASRPHIGRAVGGTLAELAPPDFFWVDRPRLATTHAPITPRWIGRASGDAPRALVYGDLPPRPAHGALPGLQDRYDEPSLRRLPLGYAALDARGEPASDALIPLPQSPLDAPPLGTSVGEVAQVVPGLDRGSPANPRPFDLEFAVESPMLLRLSHFASYDEAVRRYSLFTAPEDRPCGACASPSTRASSIRASLAATAQGQLVAFTTGDGTVWLTPLTHDYRVERLGDALRPAMTALRDGSAFGREVLFNASPHPERAEGDGSSSLLLRVEAPRLARSVGISRSAWTQRVLATPDALQSAPVLAAPPQSLPLRNARLLRAADGHALVYSLEDRAVHALQCGAVVPAARDALVRPLEALTPLRVPDALFVRAVYPRAQADRSGGRVEFYEEHPGSPWRAEDLWIGVEGAWALPGAAGEDLALVQVARRVPATACGPSAQLTWVLARRTRGQWQPGTAVTMPVVEPRFAPTGTGAYAEDLTGDGRPELVVRSGFTVGVLEWSATTLRLAGHAPSAEAMVAAATQCDREHATAACHQRWTGALPTPTSPRCGAPVVRNSSIPRAILENGALSVSYPCRRIGDLPQPSVCPDRASVRELGFEEARTANDRSFFFVFGMLGPSLVLFREPAATAAGDRTSGAVRFLPASGAWEPFSLAAAAPP